MMSMRDKIRLGSKRRRSSLQRRSLEQVQQAAARIHQADKRRVSHQDNSLHDPLAALEPLDLHFTFRSTASFQSKAAFERENNSPQSKEARGDLQGKLHGIVAAGANAATIVFIAVGMLVRVERISALGVSSQIWTLLGCLILFARSHLLQSPMQAIRDQSGEGNEEINPAKFAAVLLLVAPSPSSRSSSLSSCVVTEVTRMLMASSLYQCSRLLNWAIAATIAAWVALITMQLRFASTSGTRPGVETSISTVAEWTVPLLISLAVWVAAARTSDATRRASKRKIQEQRTLEHVGEDYVVTSTCVRNGPRSLSQTQLKEEAVRLVKLAQVLLDVSKKLTVGESNQLRLHFRAGLHSGPCVGAIAGKHRRFYRLFGDTVNTAARMCQHAPTGGVHMSQSVFDLVQGCGLNLMERGVTNIKGKGPMATYVSLRQCGNEREEHLHEKVQNILNRNIQQAGASGQLRGWMVGQFTDNRRHSTITSTAILSEKRQTTMLSLEKPCGASHNSSLFLDERETNGWHPIPKGLVTDAQMHNSGPEPCELQAWEKVLDGEIARMWEMDSDSRSVTKHFSKASSVEESLSNCVQSGPNIPETELYCGILELPPHYKRARSFCCSKDRPLAFRRSTMTFSDKAARFEWLNNPDTCVRRAASFDSGGLSTRPRHPSGTDPRPPTPPSMAGILEDLRACFPQCMHDELHEVMEPVMDLERRAPVGYAGTGGDKVGEAKNIQAASIPQPAVGRVQAGPRFASLAASLSSRPLHASGTSAASTDVRAARSALFRIPASSRRSSASAPSAEMARASEGATFVEEVQACFSSDSFQDEHLDVKQPWLDEDKACNTTHKHMHGGSLGRRRTSMFPQDLNAIVQSEGLFFAEGQTTATHQPPVDPDKRIIHWCQQPQAPDPPPMDLDASCDTPVDVKDALTPSSIFSWGIRRSTDSDHPLVPEEPVNSVRHCSLAPRPGMSIHSSWVERVSRLSGARRANFPGTRRSLQLQRQNDEQRRRTTLARKPWVEQSPDAAEAHSSRPQARAQTSFPFLDYQRVARRSEPWRAGARREPALTESHIMRKVTPADASSVSAQNMTEPYVSDLLGFCEKFNSRSRTTLVLKERMQKGAAESQTASGLRDTMVSECPSMALHVEGSASDSPFQPPQDTSQEPPTQTENDNSTFFQDKPTAGLELTPISRQACSLDVDADSLQRRASALHRMSSDKEMKVWKSLEAELSSTHCLGLGGFMNEQVEQCFAASSLQQHQPSFWPMSMKVGLYAALAVNLWLSLPASLPILARAAAAAVLVVCVSAARIPLARLMPDPHADPSWTRVLPVGVCGMLLESLQPNYVPLSLAAYILLMLTCKTLDLQKPRSVVTMLAALLTPLLGEAMATGGLLVTLVSEQALLVYVFVVVLWLNVRTGRRQTRMYWQAQRLLEKRNQLLCSVWCDLVPSVSARKFILERRLWMDFSKFEEETLLEHFSFWLQVDRSHAVVLAMDMVNFTPLANSLTPCQVVHLLHEIWCLVDECVRDPKLAQVGAVKEGEHNTMFKMDTIGDAYIAVHMVEADSQQMQAAATERVMQLAVNIQCEMLALSVWKSCAGEMAPGSLRFRMGLSCDPVVAGVVGLLQPRYHVFGAAVENARHLEAQAGGGMLHLQDKCSAMLPWLNGVNMVDLEMYNQEDTPALIEMCSGFMDTLGVNGKALQRPVIHRRLAEYIEVVENTKESQHV